MITLDSRGRMLVDGKPACALCAKRPRRWSGGRWQSYCTLCHTEYMKDWRASQRADGSILARLSPQEWAVIVDSRRPAAGRHHAGLSVEHLRRRQWAAWNWSLYLILLGAVMLVGARGFA